MSPHVLSGAARLAGSSLLRAQSDERLVALVRDGHDPAFTAVVDRYRPELLRYANRIVGASRAEDVVQQAFVNAHGAMTSNDSDIRLRPWLYRIVHNASLNALRAGRRETELDERLAATASVEHDVETRERLRDALAAIALLPEPQRDALVLQAVEGRSHEEIAAALGVSEGAARQHVHRARGIVRAAVTALTPYGLMVRFAMAGGAEPAANAALAGAGAAGAVAKIGVGVLAAGAIATGTTGHVPLLDGSSHKDEAKPAVRHEAPATKAAAAAVAVSSPATASATSSSTASGSDGRHRSGRGTSEDDGSDRHGNSGSSGASGSSDDRGGSGESEPGDDRGQSGESERGDDNGRSGGDDGTRSPSSGGQRHGSDDGGRSGSGSSGGSGDELSDDGAGTSGGSSGSGSSGSSESSGSGTSGGGSDDASDDSLLTSPSDDRSGSGGSDDGLLSGRDSSGKGSGGDDD